MSESLKDRVKLLLQNVPSLRDNSGELACHYKYSYMRDTSWEFFTHDKMESKITRLSAELQNECPELRGERWLERQNFSKTKAQEYRKPRNLGQIEKVGIDCSDIFNPIADINQRIKDTKRPFWKVLFGIH